MTQLEMIDVDRVVGQRDVLDVALEELDILEPALALVLLGERQHLVGHVEAVRFAGRSDAPRRQQHVDAAAGAEIEHGLAGLQLGQRGRIAAAERRLQREVRHFAFLAGVVQIRRDGIGSSASSADAPPQQALPAPVRDAQSGVTVFFADDVLNGCVFS